MTNTEMLAGSAKYIAYAPWRKSSLDVITAGEQLLIKTYCMISIIFG